MTAIFVAYEPDELNLPKGEILLCERLNGINRIRGFVLNGFKFLAFDRDGHCLDEKAKGAKIMWSGTKPDHVKGMDNLVQWFIEEVLPTITQKAA